ERMEDAALQPPPGERGEEGLDRIGPGAGGGREMERPARMPGEPGAHLGVLVGGIVVEDGVDQFAGGGRGPGPMEETDELLVAVPRHALSDHRAVEAPQTRWLCRAGCNRGSSSRPGPSSSAGLAGCGRAPEFATSHRPTARGCGPADRDTD